MTADKKFAVLIDAGSSTNPQTSIPEQIPKTKDQEKNISETINAFTTITTKILIIVTHGDKDHYNWLGKLMKNIKNIKKENLLYIFGGSKEHYHQDFLPQNINSTYVSDSDKTADVIDLEISKFLADSNILVKILNINKDKNKKEEDKNKNSLVTRLEYKTSASDPKPTSFMIAGDAPGEITETIIRNIKDSTGLQSDVLLASHHGASTHESNNQEWFEKVNPKYVVFSHGDTESYWHPHPLAVSLALKTSQIFVLPHVLFYGFRTEKTAYILDKDKISNVKGSDPNPGYWHTFAQIFSKYRDLGYRLLITNKAVLSTYTQGDITFAIHQDNRLDVSWKKCPGEKTSGFDADKPKNIIKAYLYKTALAKTVTDLYFNDEPLLAQEFLSWRTEKDMMPWLTSVDFSGISCDLANLSFLITQNTQITKLKLTCQDDIKRNIEEIWGHRGFTAAA